MKLDVKSFALSTGLICGFGLFSFTWWVIAFDGVINDPTLIGRLYRGYSISPSGSFVGLIWALADGFIAGGLFAWLYNKLSTNTTN
ncbi:MAG: hypothetical protein GY749_27815 [Desulfobacteraceae bacterium]|nr:hypothetical protein [Desulfobacteraceae bacterium]